MIGVPGKSKGGRTYLCLGIIFRLEFRRHNRPPLIHIDQIVLVVADHARGAGIHQCLYARLLTCLNHAFGPLHIDLVVQLLGLLADVCDSNGRSCVDHHVGFALLKDGKHGFHGCDVAIVVFYSRGSRQAIRGGA